MEGRLVSISFRWLLVVGDLLFACEREVDMSAGGDEEEEVFALEYTYLSTNMRW